VAGNSAIFGGGIENYNYGSLTLTNSTVSGNSAFGGGGIVNFGRGASLNPDQQQVSGNAAFDSGGISNYGGTVTLTNSTVLGQLGGIRWWHI